MNPQKQEELIKELKEKGFDTSPSSGPCGPTGPDQRMRQIIIETDGNDIKIVKAEVSGAIEFVGILERLIQYLNKK